MNPAPAPAQNSGQVSSSATPLRVYAQQAAQELARQPNGDPHGNVGGVSTTGLIRRPAIRAAIYIVRTRATWQSPMRTIAIRASMRSFQDMATPAFHIASTETHVSETLGNWRQHVESWLKPKPFPVHVVRFEDLVAKPTQAFTSITAS